MTLFEYVDVINKKTKYPENLSGYSQWMINKMFSCSQNFYPLAAEMTKYQLSDELHFDAYFYGVPKNTQFIKYNAKKMKAEEQILQIAEFHQVSVEVAKEYVNLISETELKTINEYFKNRGRIK